jgi:hypothetical protein
MALARIVIRSPSPATLTLTAEVSPFSVSATVQVVPTGMLLYVCEKVPRPLAGAITKLRGRLLLRVTSTVVDPRCPAAGPVTVLWTMSEAGTRL